MSRHSVAVPARSSPPSVPLRSSGVTLARLTHDCAEVPPAPPRASVDAWLQRHRRGVVRGVGAVLVAIALCGFVVEPRVTVRSGDIDVRYEADFLTPYEAGELGAAHVRGLERIEAVTGLRHSGRIVVTAVSSPGRDRGGADGVVLHYQHLDTDRVAGFRLPPHELVHVLTARLNPSPSPLLREGVAVYVSWLLDGGQALAAIPPDLAALERSEAFGLGDLHRDVKAEYGAAGTVVRFLVETRGWDRFWRIYAAGSDLDSAARVGFGAGAATLRRDVTCWLLAQGVAPTRAGVPGAGDVAGSAGAAAGSAPSSGGVQCPTA